jgi:hypothetical protein
LVSWRRGRYAGLVVIVVDPGFVVVSRKGSDQVGQRRGTAAVRRPGLQHRKRRAELVVVEVSDHHHVGLLVDGQDLVDEVVLRQGLAGPLDGRALGRELEPAVLALIAELGACGTR